MKLLRDGMDQVADTTATAVSIGSYDGIHRGHRKVLTSLTAMAQERGLEPAVVTFDQHPAAIVRPANAPLLLTDIEQRLELFEDIGIRWLYLVNFDQDRADTTSREFVENVLVRSLHARLVVVGSNFHFGKGRSGSVDSLAELGEEFGFEVAGLDLVAETDAVEPISSTAIRRALVGGDIAAANTMLGRRFEVRGAVVQGDQRGRVIGFPTANVAFSAGMAWPAKGVYAGWVQLEDGRRLASAINIGMRPTFHQHAEEPVLEAHILDFDEDLYGQVIRVEFERFLRSERRFGGIDEIAEQLKKDIESARLALGG